MAQDGEIVIQGQNIFKPAFGSAKEIKTAVKAVKAEMTAVLETEDVIKIGTNVFVKKSGVQKLALYYGITLETMRHERIEEKDGSYTYIAYCKAYKEGVPFSQTRSGGCNEHEKDHMTDKNGNPSTRKLADVIAQADTRAAGRALNALLATGMLVYEEIQGSEHEFQKNNWKPCTCDKATQTASPATASGKCMKCGGQRQ